MTTFVSALDPQDLWSHFDQILTIPRGSGQEQQIAAFVLETARGRELAADQDNTGNVVVRKPAAGSQSEVPITVLQCHLDMVWEKNSDVQHDFEKDPIVPRREGEYLQASGTTLGADNGIGVAACLALMEDRECRHGPLEFLFTVDEETGLTGAARLQPDFVQGRVLINLDSEEEGALLVGCAGGSGVDFELDLNRVANRENEALLVRLKGLRGGHSGVDIHLQRGNAVKLLARVLESARLTTPFLLSALQGGSAHNAIPREAEALLAATDGPRLRRSLEENLAAVGAEFGTVEPGLTWAVEEAPSPAETWDADSTQRLLDLLNTLPHGVASYSDEISDLVETSACLAAVQGSAGMATLHVSTRSSVTTALQALQQRLLAIGRLAGCRTAEVESYPGWQPDLSSDLLAASREVYHRATGQAPRVKAIHAGLECGLIGEKYQGMDMVSLGPQIEFPHSPDERVQIDSVGRFYRILKSLLEALAGHGG